MAAETTMGLSYRASVQEEDQALTFNECDGASPTSASVVRNFPTRRGRDRSSSSRFGGSRGFGGK
jgi:hypothetical protein